MMRWLILLIAFPLWAQTPDSTQRWMSVHPESTTYWRTKTVLPNGTVKSMVLDSTRRYTAKRLDSVYVWRTNTVIQATDTIIVVKTVTDTVIKTVTDTVIKTVVRVDTVYVDTPPAPTLKSVTLAPESATLAVTTTRQFSAYGRMSNGDSVKVTVAWTATGGTISPAGLYTSGAMPGTYRVVATVNAVADTSVVTVTKPQGSGSGKKIPFGGWNLLGTQLASPIYNVTVFGTISPWKQLAAAQANKAQIVFNLATKMSWDVVNGDTVLSVAKVKAFLDTWPTAAEMAPYFADSTIIGVIVSDDIEDKVLNGPAAPYRAKIDSLALLWKQRYGFDKLTFVRGLPGQMIGPAQGPRSTMSATNPRYVYKWLRYTWAQYHSRHGDPAAYRKWNLASADTAGLCVTFGLNATSGGDGSSGVAGSGGVGWQMSQAEVLAVSKALLPGSLVFAFWDYRGNSVNLEPAYKTVRSWADTSVQSSCR